jgi:acyl dehydratase
MSEYRFPVESTHLLFFARAIGDPAADDTDFSRAVAPPTFGIAHLQLMPHYPLRPEPLVPWVGSGRTDSGAAASGFGSGLHAEQQFEYHRPIRAGMTLLIQTVDGASWTKPRRDGGHLAFSETITELRDEADGALVQLARQVGVEIHPEPAPQDAPDAAPIVDVAGRSTGAPLATAGLPALGATRQLVAFDGLTRSQLVMYAGASGDYNPLHTDEPFATRVAGYRSVFAHGMLTMAASARVLSEWFDPQLLRSYRARFRDQVWPGDTLTVSATVTAQHGPDVVIDLVTTTQDDRVAMTAQAVAGPPPEL